jgi:SAM-dependent methyltransferase
MGLSAVADCTLSIAEHDTAPPPAYAGLAAFFDAFAAVEPVWARRNRTYHRLIRQILRFQTAGIRSVLEIGCGSGDVLAALAPERGVGVDVSPGMIAEARKRHPELEFAVASGEEISLGRTFDLILLSDLVPYVHDLVALFDRIAEHSHRRTRIVIHSYNRLWRPVIWAAELLALKPRKPIRNWVSPDDVRNLLQLSGLEAVTETRRILMPKQIPVVTLLLNGGLANVWPFNYLCLTHWVVARPASRGDRELSVSVVCPCRNERGNIGPLIERLPQMGPETELIFVEGGSSDGTREEILRQIDANPERHISLVDQPGHGKGDAVRAGFASARNDLLMILDGDLSVGPEELPKFHQACATGRAELVNGSRYVYDMEPGAMRFVNMIGNRAFRRLVKAMIGQQVKDTLCGTKVLEREDYERLAEARSYFGKFDPFGDFDLLFGAARLNLKIVDLPVRYHARTYGTTNISRWRHGLLLLRMSAVAFWKFRVEPQRLRRNDAP